jgi:microcystin-dependent protein
VSEPFLGEIKMMGFDFAPRYWAQCNGQLLPVNQNQPLFALLGTRYGGDGRVNFALPDLRGRVPEHFGSRIQGTKGGEEAHTVTQAEMPAHNHVFVADDVTASTNAPFLNARLANSTPQNLYGPFSSPTAMDPGAIANVGGSQPHDNMQPYLTINFCIALTGIFPTIN